MSFTSVAKPLWLKRKLSLAEFVCLLLWRGINESYALGHRGATKTPGPTEGPEYRPPQAIEGG